MAAHGPAELAAVVAPAFPDTARDVLERVVARFARQDTWARDPLLRRPGFDHLQEILLAGGFIARTHRYEDLVDTESARLAMASAGAPPPTA
jgi:NitT/TauT family transport system substrate-binding protein